MVRIILFIFIFSGIVYCYSDAPEFLFNDTIGYRKISKETIAFLINEMNYPNNPTQLVKYNYLFQKQPFDTLFSFPYIIIQINKNGRLSISELKELEKDLYNYDTETNYLWRTINSTVNVIIPTNYGTINVYCYSTKETFNKNNKEFKKFINSIILFRSSKYKSNFIMDIPIINNLIYKNNNFCIPIIVILIIIILFGIARRKSRVT